jgi:hypothetical protein
MNDRSADGNRGPRRPPARGGPGRAAGAPRAGGGAVKKKGGIWLQRINATEFALSHPKCIHEMELDYEEGLELRREGDSEGARDALRYALQGCGDNIWVHVALGRIALEDFNDPSLARGHFGYGFELAEKAIPRDFDGKLPREHPSNRPLYDAIDGLILCYEKLGQPAPAEELRALARRWLGTGRPGNPKG